MHLGRNNLQSKYCMNNTTLDDTNEEKDLGVLVSNDLKWSKHCLNAYTKANRVLGMINRTICSKDKRILISLYTRSSAIAGRPCDAKACQG